MIASLRHHTLSAVTLAFAALLIHALAAAPAQAGGKINSSFFSSIAIEGFDPVAYFTAHKPVEGNAAFEHEWMGATWRFASAEHRELFAKMPQKYAPQYGGYCAWAVSQGYTASIDPEAWRIVDGKLYLNYSKGIQQQWLGDIPGNIEKGDSNWPGIRAKL